MKYKLSNGLKFILCILVCQAAGIFGSLFTFRTIETWYVDLVKPEFNPPSYLFGPVWLLLYAFMGIALYLIWTGKFRKSEQQFAIKIFGIQLLLNAAWSVFFFGMQSPLLALIDIILLWIFLAYTIYLFFRLSKLAGAILIPYILWVSFAAILNFFILILNF